MTMKEDLAALTSRLEGLESHLAGGQPLEAELGAIKDRLSKLESTYQEATTALADFNAKLKELGSLLGRIEGTVAPVLEDDDDPVL